MSEALPYRVTELQPGDEAAVRGLFQEVFGKPMSSELWRWKYAKPRGAATLAWRGDELIAHYGGMPRDILYFGAPQAAMQITDVMVKPAGRKAIGKGSPFFRSASSFHERFLGFGKPCLLGFGFPNQRTFRLAEMQGLYAPIGGMSECAWDTAGAKLPWYINSRKISLEDGAAAGREEGERSAAVASRKEAGSSTSFDRQRPAVDAAWRLQAADLRGHIVGVKDAAFLERRYLRHPEKRYELRLLRRRLSGRVYGVAVLFHEAGHSLLMDLVGPLDALGVLIEGARAAAAEAGRPLLKTWCANGFAARFALQGARQEALPIVIPTGIWTPAPDPAQLQDKWWLMPGDSDFL